MENEVRQRAYMLNVRICSMAGITPVSYERWDSVREYPYNSQERLLHNAFYEATKLTEEALIPINLLRARRDELKRIISYIQAVPENGGHGG